MSCVYSSILGSLGLPATTKNIRVLGEGIKECEYQSRLRIIYRELSDNANTRDNSFCMTFDEARYALGDISEPSFTSMVKRGESPPYFRIGDKPKSPYRFPILGIAEFLLKKDKG